MTRQELYKQADVYKEKIAANQLIDHMDSEVSEGSVYSYLYTLAKEKEIQITEELLKKFHELVLEEKGLAEEAGSYRKIMIKGIGTRHMPPAPEELEHLMSHFIGQMQISRQMFHPIEFAAICHKRVMEICPFKEGNEEVAMLVMNLILVHHGYGMIKSFKNQEDDYLRTLEAAQHPSSPDIDSFIEFIARCVVKVEEEECKKLGIA